MGYEFSVLEVVLLLWLFSLSVGLLVIRQVAKDVKRRWTIQPCPIHDTSDEPPETAYPTLQSQSPSQLPKGPLWSDASIQNNPHERKFEELLVTEDNFLGILMLDELLQRLMAYKDRARKENTRSVASFGQPYTYTGSTHRYAKFPAFLNRLKEQIEKKLGCRLNQCSLTFYEAVFGCIPRHGDTEKSIVKGSKIVGLTVIGVREFAIYRNADNTLMGSKNVMPGSLFVMEQCDQRFFSHTVVRGHDPRISLTFRHLMVSDELRALKTGV